MKKIPLIDLVRTFSILAVLAHHLGLSFITSTTTFQPLAILWFKLWASGYYGVWMFFLISGFLITRVIASSPGGLFQPDFRDFYARRVGRIFPLLAFICILGMGLNAFISPSSPGFENCLLLPSGPHISLFWLSIVTFTENLFKIFIEPHGYRLSLGWGVLWSLAIEEQFYLFYPFILKALGNRRRLVYFLVLMIIVGPSSTAIASLFWHKYRVIAFNPAASYNSFAGFGLIAMGCLLHLVLEQFQNQLAEQKKLRASLCLLGLLIMGITYWHINVSIDFGWMDLGPSLVGAGLFLFLLGAMDWNIWNADAFKILSLPGQYSYGGYLYHAFILFVFWSFFKGMNDFQAYFLFICATTLVSWLSYRYYEMPLNALIRKYFGSPPKK